MKRQTYKFLKLCSYSTQSLTPTKPLHLKRLEIEYLETISCIQVKLPKVLSLIFKCGVVKDVKKIQSVIGSISKCDPNDLKGPNLGIVFKTIISAYTMMKDGASAKFYAEEWERLKNRSDFAGFEWKYGLSASSAGELSMKTGQSNVFDKNLQENNKVEGKPGDLYRGSDLKDNAKNADTLSIKTPISDLKKNKQNFASLALNLFESESHIIIEKVKSHTIIDIELKAKQGNKYDTKKESAILAGINNGEPKIAKNTVESLTVVPKLSENGASDSNKFSKVVAAKSKVENNLTINVAVELAYKAKTAKSGVKGLKMPQPKSPKMVAVHLRQKEFDKHIMARCKRAKVSEVEMLVNDVEGLDVFLTQNTYEAMIQMYAKLDDIDKMEATYYDIKREFFPKIGENVYKWMAAAYKRKGMLQKELLFRENDFCYGYVNSIAKALKSESKLKFEEVQKNLRSGASSFNYHKTIFIAHSLNGHHAGMDAVLNVMLAEGLKPDPDMYLAMLPHNIELVSSSIFEEPMNAEI